jgi:hypothetical protein
MVLLFFCCFIDIIMLQCTTRTTVSSSPLPRRQNFVVACIYSEICYGRLLHPLIVRLHRILYQMFIRTITFLILLGKLACLYLELLVCCQVVPHMGRLV